MMALKYGAPEQAAEQMARLTFDAASHRYLLDGERQLVSVTTVVGDYYTGPKAPPERLRAAANRGTVAHALIDADERGDERAVRQEPGYVASARAWRRHRGFETLHVETRLFHEGWGVAGTADRIGVFMRPNYPPQWWRWGESVKGIVDWKTGRISSGVPAQLAAYRGMLSEWGVVGLDCPIVAVGITRDGQWRDRWFLGPDPDFVWAGMLSLRFLRGIGFEGE